MKIDSNPTSPTLLVHPFKDMLPDVDEFFKADNDTGAINTINSLCHRINKLSAKYSGRIREEDFKGYALELFAEYFLKTNGSENRVGILDYVPTNKTEDYGVDGHGIGANGHPATVQVKFRSGDYTLSANEDGLSNFLACSQNDYLVPLEDDKNMLIITTGLKVAPMTMENMLKGKVRVLAREDLRVMLDNYPEWWIRFYEAVKASRTIQKPILVKTLRDHQMEAVVAILADLNHKGKVILPTGTGKTLIQAEVILQDILQCRREGIIPIIKVNSPRILLCFQLFEEIRKHLMGNGIEARYMNYNSGQADENTFAVEARMMGGAFREIVSTTSVQEVKDAYEKAKNEKIPLIVFSTYHSAEKFATSGLVPHLTIHDEAHNLVSFEFGAVATLPSVQNYFFTATEKITEEIAIGDNYGMNHVPTFGNVIYTRSAKQMIDVGEMVAPWVHVVKAQNGAMVNLNALDRDYDALLRSIIEAFLAHKAEIRKLSYNPDKLGAKVLVVCRGQIDLEEMFNTKVFDSLTTDYPKIKIYALSSDFGIYAHGKKEKSPVTASKKFKLLKEIQELGQEEDAIIFHVDMIGEGVDVPGITGVMPFRNCELAKFVQNIGRASRLHPDDRKQLYQEDKAKAKAFLDDKSKWVKPCSWVIIPTFLLSAEGFDVRFREIVETLRTKVDWMPSQMVLVDNGGGIDTLVEKPPVNEPKKDRPHTISGIGPFINEFDALTFIEQIILETEVDNMKRAIRIELGIAGIALPVVSPIVADPPASAPADAPADPDDEVFEFV